MLWTTDPNDMPWLQHRNWWDALSRGTWASRCKKGCWSLPKTSLRGYTVFKINACPAARWSDCRRKMCVVVAFHCAQDMGQGGSEEGNISMCVFVVALCGLFSTEAAFEIRYSLATVWNKSFGVLGEPDNLSGWLLPNWNWNADRVWTLPKSAW